MENENIPPMHGVVSFKVTDKGVFKAIALNKLTVGQLGHLYMEMSIVQRDILTKIEGGNRDESISA